METVPLLASAVLAALVAPGALRAFREAGWTRENYRGEQLPFPAGAIAVAVGIVALGALAAVERIFDVDLLTGLSEGGILLFGITPPTFAPHWLYEVVALNVLFIGVAFIGLLDDMLDAPARGWRGHARAVLRGGGLSTGALKAVGTLALAAACLPGSSNESTSDYVLAIAVIALTTNLFNLLDLRPGRSAKAFAALGAGLLIGTADAEVLRTLGPLAGPLLVLGVFDLRERAMLGDTGSNVLGALAGVWLVLALGTTGQLIALGVLIFLTIYGELESFSKTIDRVAPLRWLDRLGRPG